VHELKGNRMSINFEFLIHPHAFPSVAVSPSDYATVSPALPGLL